MFFKLFLHPEGDSGLADNTDAAIDTAPVEPATPTEPTPEPVKEPEPAKGPDVETQEVFSKRLAAKTEEAKAALLKEIDAEYAEMGMEWNGKPITTRAEYKAAMQEQKLAAEAAKQNVPVEILQELQTTKSTAQQALDKLSKYERKEQLETEAKTLSADPAWGDFFKANEKAIRETADRSNCDLWTAKLLVMDKLGVPKVDEAAIGQKAVQDYLTKAKLNSNPVEGGGATPVAVQSTPKTFKEAYEASRAILRAQREL